MDEFNENVHLNGDKLAFQINIHASARDYKN